jgi:lantibiotic biosynthesis protein
MVRRAQIAREPSPVKPDSEFLPSGFFALRTALLPFDEFLAWSDGLEAEAARNDPILLEKALTSDRDRLRERLHALIDRGSIREALFIASPDLDESLEIWMRDPDSERGGRVERAVVRYFARMAGRPTPFGLFAGSSVGKIGDRTRLVIGGQEKSGRHSRLDMDYLFALAEAIGRDPALRRAFNLRPNSSLYRTAGRVHYVEARLEGKSRTHHLVAVEDSEELRATLVQAAGGAAEGPLAATLVNDDVCQAEAEEYVGDLIDSQILRPDLSLFVTGPEPTPALASRLREHPETAAIGELLEQVQTELAAIDAAGSSTDPERYREIARQLEGLPAPVEISRLFQVDMVKSSPEASLGGPVLDEILGGLNILRHLARSQRSDDLLRFREAFQARYEGRAVPLVEALDEEAGIGFPPASGATADGGPLLAGIDLSPASEEVVVWGRWEEFQLRKLMEATARREQEIALEPRDFEQHGNNEPLPLPDAFAVVATAAAASEEALSRGEFRLLWIGTDGPSGASMLGRFCHADPELHRSVSLHLRAEEARDPEAVFAEVVHLPQGRLGNILCRPVLRDYEIPYLGESGAPADRQIAITDLFVSVSGGLVVLRSERLGRRVIPRLTSAHNFRGQGLGLYRFLSELQGQGTAGSLGWDWGPLWSASFLPRVVCGRLVLSPAQWNVDKDELKRLSGARGMERFRILQSWREERGLPRLVIVADGDNKLPIDLTNVLSIESFIHLIKGREQVRLVEMFPGPDELYALGPEGRFLHELIVPFVRASAVAAGSPRVGAAKKSESPPPDSAVRSFPPGSEWIYAKLYAGTSSADRVLRGIVGPIVRDALDSGAADRWFFIRYGDPDWHLRVRLHGEPARLLDEVLPALRGAVAPLLADGQVWKVQLDTYEREVERYGGADGVELAERIFQADSAAALEILEMLEEGDEGSDERWRLTLSGIDLLLQDFGFDSKAMRSLLEEARQEFAKELRTDAGVRRELGDRFRKECKAIELLLDASRAEEGPLAPGLAVLRGRSSRLAPLIADMKGLERAGRLSRPLMAIAPSFVHMHVNRMLCSMNRNSELVLYDFLARIYEARAARAKISRG